MTTHLNHTMRLFFIVGAQKSGSTWLQRSLNDMDGVHCLGEGHFIDRLVKPIAETTGLLQRDDAVGGGTGVRRQRFL